MNKKIRITEDQLARIKRIIQEETTNKEPKEETIDETEEEFVSENVRSTISNILRNR